MAKKIDFSKFDVVYPSATIYAPIVDRDKTIGETDSALKVLSGETTLLERHDSNGAFKSLCRYKGTLPDAWARVLNLAVETLKGRDSLSARKAAVVVRATMQSDMWTVGHCDLLFTGKADAEITAFFPETKSTPSLTTDSETWAVKSTIGDVLASALQLAAFVDYLDANTTREITAPKKQAKAIEKQVVSVDLDW